MPQVASPGREKRLHSIHCVSFLLRHPALRAAVAQQTEAGDRRGAQFSSCEVTECQAQVLSAPSVPSGAVLSPVPLPLCPVCTSSSDASIHPALNSSHPPISALQTAVGRGPGLAIGLCPFCPCRCACHVYRAHPVAGGWSLQTRRDRPPSGCCGVPSVLLPDVTIRGGRRAWASLSVVRPS